jgi:hypothetical protein
MLRNELRATQNAMVSIRNYLLPSIYCLGLLSCTQNPSAIPSPDDPGPITSEVLYPSLVFSSIPQEITPPEPFSISVHVLEAPDHLDTHFNQQISLSVLADPARRPPPLEEETPLNIIKSILKKGKTPTWLKGFLLSKLNLQEYTRSLLQADRFPLDLISLVNLIEFPPELEQEFKELVRISGGFSSSSDDGQYQVSLKKPANSGKATFDGLKALPTRETQITLVAKAEGMLDASLSIPIKPGKQRPITVVLNGSPRSAIYTYPNAFLIGKDLFRVFFVSQDEFIVKKKRYHYQWLNSNKVKASLIGELEVLKPSALKSKQLRTKN